MSFGCKNAKISKILRQKGQEFLDKVENRGILYEIIRHFESGADPMASLLTLEMVFSNLLKNRTMYVEIVPLKLTPKDRENENREGLKRIYEECFGKILCRCEDGTEKIQLQALTTAMNLLGQEGKFPLEHRNESEHYLPLIRLKAVLMKVLSNSHNTTTLINKYDEYLQFDDVLFYTWKVLPSLTAKSNPNDVYILNYLLLLQKLKVSPNKEIKLFCSKNMNENFNFEENVTRKCLNKVWNCIMQWEHTQATHKQLLIVLLEFVLPYLDKPLLLTDFLMDSLDVGGPVGLLALQGIFNLVQKHNLDYPDIFSKLYSMFEPEIFHTKFKARLFYLSDIFLSSTHLPEALVAAFVKRLARLALIAPSEDIIVICMFIGNLILRHPGLKCLLNHPTGATATSDPYIMEERDPLKSNAISSSLWELQTLQQHVNPSVSTAAKFINSPLPSIEWDMSQVLDNTGDDLFDKEIKKHGKILSYAFLRPVGATLSRGDKTSVYWSID